ncbi:MAG: hypothetical protein V9G12_04370 [Microthrixaceae bacterium]
MARPSVPDDTDREIAERQADMWRDMTPAEHFEIARSLTSAVTAMAIAGIRFDYPGISEDDLRRELLRRRYGEEIACAVHGPSRLTRSSHAHEYR